MNAMSRSASVHGSTAIQTVTPASTESVVGGILDGNDPEGTSDLPECSYVPQIPQLIRRSLKRSLDMFIGSMGLPRSHYSKFGPTLGEFRLKHARIKLHDEFTACLDDSQAPDVGEASGDAAVTASQARGRNETTALVPVAGGVLLAAPGGGTMAVAAPPRSVTSSTLLIRRTGPLEHLTFKKTVNIPAPVRHRKWELKRVIAGHHGWVRTLAVDPATNEWFASSGNDRLIKIWDIANGSLRLSLTGHVNTVRAMTISSRRPYLFSAGEDQMVKCWDLEQNKVVRHYHGHLSGVYCLDLHPSLDVLATGGRDAVVRIWDVRTKRPIHVFAGHAATVMSLRAREGEPQLISGSLDKTIRCWDLVAGRASAVLTQHKKAIRALAVHPSEQTLCSAGADHVKLWNLPGMTCDRNLESQGVILNALAVRANDDIVKSSLVVAGSDAGHLCFWDWTSGRRVQTIETIPQPGSLSCERAIYALVFDMSQTRILTGECDKTIKVWAEKVDEEGQ